MAIKGKGCYEYRCYTGTTPTRVVSRKRKFGAELDIVKNTNFGLRSSSNGQEIRMIVAGDERDVYTLTSDQYASLVRNSVKYDYGYVPNLTMAR